MFPQFCVAKWHHKATMSQTIYCLTYEASILFSSIHYPKTVVPEETKSSHKPLWSSEDFSSYADDGGAKHWAQVRSLWNKMSSE